MDLARGRLALLGSALGLLAVAAQGAAASTGQDPAPEVEFERDVLPILEASCTRCHGAEKQKAGMRLDSYDAVLAGSYGGKYPVVVAGAAEESELLRRLVSEDLDERMPPDGDALAAEQVQVVQAWLELGATGRSSGVALAPAVDHWAYRPPVRPDPPTASADGSRNAIDAFVLARLAAEGLAPSPQAERAVLLRRVSLDLTGLPPTLEEVDAFLAEGASSAYGRAVDRLLASPHYGEHMARRWLDLARYADSNGYEKDELRTMHLWRDWVIDAFNADMPFDRFTVEQLAGDLLPDATVEQRIATGFHRNTMLNREGGTDPEEFRVDAVVDRVNTTATVWLGTTLACAQCHDHKYDPFSQRDYYELFAFYDSTQDDGGQYEPLVRVPTQEQEQRLSTLAADLEAAGELLDDGWPGAGEGQAAWERARAGELAVPPTWRVLAPSRAVSTNGTTLRILPDGSVLASGDLPTQDVYELVLRPEPGLITALRLETLTDESLPGGGPGRAEHGNFVLTELAVEASSLTAPDRTERLGLVGADADHEQPTFRATRAIDGDDESGWAIAGGIGAPREALFALSEPLRVDDATVLRVSLHFDSGYAQHLAGRTRISATDDARLAQALAAPSLGPWRAAGPYEAAFAAELPADAAWTEQPAWRDGAIHALEAPENSANWLERTLESDRERAVTAWIGSDDGVRVWLNGELVHATEDARGAAPDQDRVPLRLRTGENHLRLQVTNGAGTSAFFFDLDARDPDRLPGPVAAALASRDDRAEADVALLTEHFRRHVSERGRELVLRLEQLGRERDELEAAVPTALVLEELAEPRETRVHERGSFLRQGERVHADVPGVLHELPSEGARDRLALAHWLVDPAGPLTARVTANRLWEQVFGRGIVATSDDFGTRGDPPTHPQLLDWLALELVENGWSQKQLLRTIVTSATYRQSSRVSPELLERDPDNLLFARGPRFRVSAETVRDVALAASGLLDRTVGGPSVYPPQPDGIWAATYSADRWDTPEDSRRWRRGLYTFWRRTAPYPSFMVFDATSREISCARRSRSNTPLQALVLLNDPVFVEAAGALARRMLAGAGDARERAELGFRLCLARRPEPGEVEVLVRLAQSELEHFAADPDAAAQLASGDDPVELAAWTVVAGALLNLDEVITKG